MRNALISIAAGVAIFMLGVFILNAQLWYSSRADSLAGARYAIKNINAILQEARHAAQTAMSLTGKACDIETLCAAAFCYCGRSGVPLGNAWRNAGDCR
jgi:hypothetical protein